MALIRIAEIGEMTVDLDVDAQDRATGFVVTHARRARPAVRFRADGGREEFAPRLQEDQGSTIAFPVRIQLTRQTVVHPKFGTFPNQLMLPPFIFTEHE